MKRIAFAVSFLGMAVFSCIGAGGFRSTSGTQPPVITHSYAVDKGSYGQTWKIYIEAEDPDGDMLKIASVLQQEGVRYRQPVDYIFLKKSDQKYVKGFLSLETYNLREPSATASPRLTLKVTIIDKAGNESKQAVFNLDYVGEESGSGASLPAPFDQGNIPKLGNILIEGKYPPQPTA